MEKSDSRTDQIFFVIISGGVWTRKLPAPLNTALSANVRRLPATIVINSPWCVAAECIVLAAHSTRWSQAQNRDFCLSHLHSTSTPMQLGGPRRNIAMTFGTEKKLEWFGYPVLKKFRRYSYSFWQNSRTWRIRTRRTIEHCMTDRPRICIASRHLVNINVKVLLLLSIFVTLGVLFILWK